MRWLFPMYDRWEEHAVPELDSALNNWHEIPFAGRFINADPFPVS
jgi:hypothetical protein